ncbi:Cu(I)-responsive transcriptional regulator [Paraburkholderia fungorum]|uniref:Cu(I)-responsive transcriptional regulator n=1 Tax=Paraburkholderia fungorum TaxID=134537 RepID=A0AAP5QCY0_9BURK|nr:Cu(I)-responsive transcriptional regulator [Paraburkholderia fungorum]MDT8840185.1 Cu(I)-responsive transcriptional regulator [Paraburkholderia fungorum]
MNIGEAAKLSSVPAKMIRYYEQIGLVRSVHRTRSNYRTYGQAEVEVLRFVDRARRLGFSMKQTALLLELWQDRSRPGSEVKRLATEHIAELDQRIREMTAMKSTLEYLASHCRGDSRPECPILDELAGNRHMH